MPAQHTDAASAQPRAIPVLAWSMQLVIVRHADAGDAEDFALSGRPDSERPLSPKGHRQMRRAIPGLRTLVPACQAIVSSPYVRARQTAEHLRAAYGLPALLFSATLEPDEEPEAFVQWLRAQPARAVVIAVGHEPNLGLLVEWVTSGTRDGEVSLRKGGAALVDCERSVAAGKGILRWLKSARELASLDPE